MITRSTLAKGAVGAAASLAALVAASGVQAQAYYDQRGGYAYDPCARSTTNRGTGGGLAGAALGAAIGGSVAAGGAKTEGAVLGGLLGAVAGSQIGKSSAACAPGYSSSYAQPAYAPPPPPPQPPRAYYDDRAYGYSNGGAYAQGGYQGVNPNDTYYDVCARSRTQRGTGAGLAGAALGAVAGGSIAAGGAKTEGAVLGGLLGAAVGANIGRNSAACTPGYVAQPQDYAQPYASYPQQGYSTYESYDRYDSRNTYGGATYDGRSYSSTVADSRSDVNGCTLAESPIYLPDGRTQKRFVRVCPDGQGRYQVVD